MNIHPDNLLWCLAACPWQMRVLGLAGASMIVASAAVDEHTTIPLYTGISVSVALIGFSFSIGWQLRKVMDRMTALEHAINGDPENGDKCGLRGEVSLLKADLDALRKERDSASDLLRAQLRAASFLEPVPEQTQFRILLVEDDPADRDLLRRKLTPVFALDESKSLTEANRRLSQQVYDCVLLDLNLPDVNIKHTVQEFRRHNPDALCIVLTGSADSNLTQAALAQGVDDVWFKGKDDIDIKKMSRRLREAIWRRRARRAQ